MQSRALVPFGLLLLASATSMLAIPTVDAAPASGPLRPHPANTRYFADPSGKAVYLTGAHTWNNLIDMGRDDPPKPFDFDAYLDALERHHHNFIRLWAWDSFLWDTRANGTLGKDFVHKVAPLPWARTGSDNALDGKPKFDLTKLDTTYFDRLRSRVDAARRRGIYVSVMLFEGWCLHHANRGRDAPAGWAWKSNPFHPDNNVNALRAGKEGDAIGGDVHNLLNPAVNAIQAAYVRKVVDTVNDLDNVLYEVVNEGGEKEWDWWVVKTVHDYEKTKPKQHPVGLTGHGAERIDSMLASDAEWVSPGSADGYAEDPPAWNAKKVSIIDTDHVWGVGGTPAWVWKSFLRGHNPIFMDPYDGSILGKPSDPQWEPMRAAMGQARKLAERLDLASMTPRGELCSTGYCLANAGKEYVMYQPAAGAAFTIELKAGAYRAEWTKPATSETVAGGRIESAGKAQEVKAPFEGEAVLHIAVQ